MKMRKCGGLRFGLLRCVTTGHLVPSHRDFANNVTDFIEGNDEGSNHEDSANDNVASL